MCMAAEWGLFGVLRWGVLGCVSPSPPAPLPLRGRGEDFEFFVVLKADVAPLAPGRGEGSGVRGDDPAWTLIM
jgi:hypothetical protein